METTGAARGESGALSTSAYVVLGMLRLGAKSGYDVKRAVDLSARHFWTISEAQVYPELKRLREAGLVKGDPDPDGGSRRPIIYELTPSGEIALAQWLRHAAEASHELRDLGLLKLFFADALPTQEVLDHVRAMRWRHDAYLSRLRDEIEPTARRMSGQRGHRFPLLVARFSLDYHLWLANWFGALERELVESLDRDAGHP